MSDDYRVPVARVEAKLWQVAGGERHIVLFCPPDDGVMSLLEDERAFFPATEGDAFLLISRPSVAALWVPAPEPLAHEEDLPKVSRAVGITLADGRSIHGRIEFVSSGVQDRTGDYLNESSPFFCVRVW